MFRLVEQPNHKTFTGIYSAILNMSKKSVDD